MPERSPEKNPWYLLATLHGKPDQRLLTSDPTRSQNRLAWNRWMASALDDVERESLIATGRYSRLELTPLSDDEVADWRALFKSRAGDQSGLMLVPPRLEMSISGFDFGQDIEWRGCIFPVHLQMTDCSFAAMDPFRDCDFLGLTDFSKSRFMGPVTSLTNNRFDNSTEFRGAEFSHPTSFLGTEFEAVGFQEVTFKRHVDFFFLKFNSNADFSGAVFKDAAVFDNAEFKWRLSFRKAQFERPPLFLNSKLPDGLDFREVQWPRLRAKTKSPQEFIEGYQRLKSEMDRQKLHEQELLFFGCEMQARGTALGNKTLDGFTTAIYGALSDYGRSYVRPLGWLALLIILGGLAGFAVTGRPILEAFGQSFSDTLSVFGFRKEAAVAVSAPPRFLVILGAIQTIIGSALIFLFLLALQKRFRMR